jgi:hypothetical protein
MKKIILAIFTMILTLAIFGCGKTASGGGGGSSGGGGGGTPQTFSVQGVVSGVSQFSGMSVQAATDYTIKVLQFTDNAQWGGTWTPDADGKYRIDGLPLGKVFTVVVEQGDTRMKNLAYAMAKEKGEVKQVDLTPTSTATAEVLSKNAAAREMLEVFDADTEIDGAIQTVQEKVNKIYNDNPDNLPTTNITVDESGKLDSIENSVIKTYTLTVGVSPNAAVQNGCFIQRVPSLNNYLENTRVKLNLMTRGGWGDFEWSINELGTNDTAYIVMDENKNVTANLSWDPERVPRFVPDISDIDTWEYDSSVGMENYSRDMQNKQIYININGENREYIKHPLSNPPAGAKILGTNVGKKDGRLYVMLKLGDFTGTAQLPNPAVQYVVEIRAEDDSRRISEGCFIRLTHNGSTWNAESFWQMADEEEDDENKVVDKTEHQFSPDKAKVERSDNLVIVSMPISDIKGRLDKYPPAIYEGQRYYSVTAETNDGRAPEDIDDIAEDPINANKYPDKKPTEEKQYNHYYRTIQWEAIF